MTKSRNGILFALSASMAIAHHGASFAGEASIDAAKPMAEIAQPTKERPFLPRDGRELKKLIDGCSEDACMSYISGVIGGIAIYAALAEKPSPFCANGDVSRFDIRDAISETIESTDALADQHPAVAVLAAFSRYWPCATHEDVRDLATANLEPANPDLVQELVSSGGHGIVMGDADAPATKTLIVMSDVNCAHCRRFRNVIRELAENGWKILVYPVSVVAEESAGYGAVQIAVRDIDEKASIAMHEFSPEGVADITAAMKIADESGVEMKDILLALATSGAYDKVKKNTEIFYKMGAKGTPAIIIGESMHSGYMPAQTIMGIAETMEGERE